MVEMSSFLAIIKRNQYHVNVSMFRLNKHKIQCQHGTFYPRLSVMWFQSWRRSSGIGGGGLHNTWKKEYTYVRCEYREFTITRRVMFNKIKLVCFSHLRSRPTEVCIEENTNPRK